MILSSLFTMSSTPPWIGLMPTSKSAKAGVGSARPFPAGGHDNTSPWLWHVCARSSARKPWNSSTPPNPRKELREPLQQRFSFEPSAVLARLYGWGGCAASSKVPFGVWPSLWSFCGLFACLAVFRLCQLRFIRLSTVFSSR